MEAFMIVSSKNSADPTQNRPLDVSAGAAIGVAGKGERALQLHRRLCAFALDSANSLASGWAASCKG
jgi:hypothetical protein